MQLPEMVLRAVPVITTKPEPWRGITFYRRPGAEGKLLGFLAGAPGGGSSPTRAWSGPNLRDCCTWHTGDLERAAEGPQHQQRHSAGLWHACRFRRHQQLPGLPASAAGPLWSPHSRALHGARGEDRWL
eukprot:4684764-Alexandrium_andersonii.AAC.1